jgi:hypothetical protein
MNKIVLSLSCLLLSFVQSFSQDSLEKEGFAFRDLDFGLSLPISIYFTFQGGDIYVLPGVDVFYKDHSFFAAPIWSNSGQRKGINLSYHKLQAREDRNRIQGFFIGDLTIFCEKRLVQRQQEGAEYNREQAYYLNAGYGFYYRLFPKIQARTALGLGARVRTESMSVDREASYSWNSIGFSPNILLQLGIEYRF